MLPKQLRCYAEKKGNVWQAFCVDLNLAVQGRSFADVKTKLHRQIDSYLYDALEGEDRAHAKELLSRRAPLRYRVKYQYLSVMCRIHSAKHGLCHVFSEIIPPNMLHQA